jgi:large subunit ribosomal protein L1
MNPLRPSYRALATPLVAQSSPFSLTVRSFSTSPHNAASKAISTKSKEAAAKAKQKRKKKKHTHYKMPVLAELKQYPLVDAIQHIRAFEVGRSFSIPKLDLAVRLRTKKDGPVLRNTIRLPHAVKTDIRVCVICDPNSKQAKQAKEAGAVLVGEDDIFEVIKEGKIDFDRCIATPLSLPKMQKAGIPRILGPRGLMPSVKLGTVTDNVAQQVQTMMGGSTYRERQGVIRMAVAQLGFTPEQVRDNVRAFLNQVKKEAVVMSDNQGFAKSVYEVVSSLKMATIQC